MFSQTAEYALRAVVWLAEHRSEGPAGNQKVAEQTQVPVTYLAKILQQLTKAGLIRSRRGAGGGFELVRDPVELTVLEVVNAVDPVQRLTDCPLKLRTHRTRRCAMHARLDQAIAKVEEVLSSSTIADILSDGSRPIPMRNERT